MSDTMVEECIKCGYETDCVQGVCLKCCLKETPKVAGGSLEKTASATETQMFGDDRLFIAARRESFDKASGWSCRLTIHLPECEYENFLAPANSILITNTQKLVQLHEAIHFLLESPSALEMRRT